MNWLLQIKMGNLSRWRQFTSIHIQKRRSLSSLASSCTQNVRCMTSSNSIETSFSDRSDPVATTVLRDDVCGFASWRQISGHNQCHHARLHRPHPHSEQSLHPYQIWAGCIKAFMFCCCLLRPIKSWERERLPIQFFTRRDKDLLSS